MLAKSTHFADLCRAQFFETPNKRIDLPNEEPEIFSAVLEYLYKGDYTPRLAFDKKRGNWYLDNDEGITAGENVVYPSAGAGNAVLKDTVVYVSSFFIIPPVKRCSTKHF